jgi:hypothetical protein
MMTRPTVVKETPRERLELNDLPNEILVKETPRERLELNDLPNEILVKIISFLPLGTRRHVLPFVSPRFHDIVRDLDQNVTIHVHEGPEIGGLTERDLRRMMAGHRRTTVSSVYIYGDKLRFTWDFLNAGGVLSTVQWANLKCFSMTGEFPVFDSNIFVDAARAGYLWTLEQLVLRLETWPVPCTALGRWDMPGLRYLELETGVDYRAFLARPEPRLGPFNHMSRLERLKLVWSPDILYSRVGEVPFARFVNAVLPPSVTELTVETQQLGDFCLTGISGSFPKVRLFRIKFAMLLATQSARNGHELLRVFPDLRELVVYGIPNIDATEFTDFYADMILRGLRRAWSFEVTESKEIDGVTQVQVVRFFR